MKKLLLLLSLITLGCQKLPVTTSGESHSYFPPPAAGTWLRKSVAQELRSSTGILRCGETQTPANLIVGPGGKITSYMGPETVDLTLGILSDGGYVRQIGQEPSILNYAQTQLNGEFVVQQTRKDFAVNETYVQASMQEVELAHVQLSECLHNLQTRLQNKETATSVIDLENELSYVRDTLLIVTEKSREQATKRVLMGGAGALLALGSLSGIENLLDYRGQIRHDFYNVNAVLSKIHSSSGQSTFKSEVIETFERVLQNLKTNRKVVNGAKTVLAAAAAAGLGVVIYQFYIEMKTFGRSVVMLTEDLNHLILISNSEFRSYVRENPDHAKKLHKAYNLAH